MGGGADKLSARRPELYDNLTLSNYLWNPLEFHGLYNHQPLPLGRRSLVAAAQIAPRPGDYAGNFALLEQALADISKPSERQDRTGVDLIVFPEYALTGCPTAERLEIALSNEEATAWHGRLVELAQRYDKYLVVGYAEQCCGQIFWPR